MIGQYLSQTNESATVPVLQKILELNKALGNFKIACSWSEDVAIVSTYFNFFY